MVSRGIVSRCAHHTAVLRATGVFWGLLALAGCSVPRLATTTIHAPVGPTPTVITARSAVHDAQAAPPWRGVPLDTRTMAGTPGDPINVAFEGSRSTILAAFHAIGWVQADPLSRRDDLRLVRDVLEGKRYPAAPVSALYLFGRPEDIAVEHELGSVTRRDHARLWDTNRIDPRTGETLWIGDAARDIAIEVVRKHGFTYGFPIGTTHRIGPNIDAERHGIVSAMREAGVVQVVVMEPGIGPTTDGRNGENNRYSTDGKVAVIVVRTSLIRTRS